METASEIKDTRKEIIIGALKEYYHDTGKSQASVAKEIGLQYGKMSDATLSQMHKGNWDNISDEMWNKLAAYLGVDEEWKTLETNNLSTIFETADTCRKQSRFLALIGESGYGKTESLTAYKRKHKAAVYVLCNFLMTRKKFLRAIQNSLGISEGTDTTEMLYAICRKLNTMKRPVLLLDDAGKLNDGNMRILQLIFDETEDRCGLLLAGMPFLQYVIERSRTANKMGYGELWRRIEDWIELEKPTAKEISTFCEHYGVTNSEVVSLIINRTEEFGTIKTMIREYKRMMATNTFDMKKLQRIKYKKPIAA